MRTPGIEPGKRLCTHRVSNPRPSDYKSCARPLRQKPACPTTSPLTSQSLTPAGSSNRQDCHDTPQTRARKHGVGTRGILGCGDVTYGVFGSARTQTENIKPEPKPEPKPKPKPKNGHTNTLADRRTAAPPAKHDAMGTVRLVRADLRRVPKQTALLCFVLFFFSRRKASYTSMVSSPKIKPYYPAPPAIMPAGILTFATVTIWTHDTATLALLPGGTNSFQIYIFKNLFSNHLFQKYLFIKTIFSNLVFLDFRKKQCWDTCFFFESWRL